MSKISLLEKLLDENYFESGKDDAMDLLSESGLDSHFSKLLEILSKENFLSSNNNDKDYFGKLSSTFLTRVNSVIEEAQGEKKRKLEQLASDISYRILVNEIINSGRPIDEAVEGIVTGLKDSCEINGWNFKILSHNLRLELLRGTETKKAKTQQTNRKQCHYSWQLSESLFEDFLEDLRDDKAIKSINEFRKLFYPSESAFEVRCARGQLDFLLILFEKLDEYGIIKAVGFRGAKKFTPLFAYSVDFDGKVLMDKEPKRIKAKIQRDPKKHALLLDKAEKRVRSYIREKPLLD